MLLGATGVLEIYTSAGLSALMCLSNSSTVPLGATPVGVPSRVQKIQINKSLSLRTCQFIVACGWAPISGVVCVSQPTGSNTASFVDEFTAFHSFITFLAIVRSSLISPGEAI